MECFTKIVKCFWLLTIFAIDSMLDVWQGSEYASGLLNLFYSGLKRDTLEWLLHAKLIIVFTSKFFPYSEVMHGSTIFKLIKC